MNFCTKCFKIVPDNEVQILSENSKVHHYFKIKNAYNNSGSDRIGYLPVEVPIYCGSVREPTDIEYFITQLLTK